MVRSPLPMTERGERERCPTSTETYLGRFFTSLSHFDSRRRRSSDEPYFAKSKLMSLISSSLGACGGIGVPLLEGTWYCLVWPPRACAVGVNAQSYQRLALSRLRAPLMIDMEPIS